MKQEGMRFRLRLQGPLRKVLRGSQSRLIKPRSTRIPGNRPLPSRLYHRLRHGSHQIHKARHSSSILLTMAIQRLRAHILTKVSNLTSTRATSLLPALILEGSMTASHTKRQIEASDTTRAIPATEETNQEEIEA